jgi:Putative adhesin
MSRTSIVAMLIAAEVLIVGMAIYAVGHGGRSFAAGLKHVDFSAAPIAPVAAGAAPRVVIDDAASRVHVDVSPDELVHVSDLTEMHGAVYSTGSYPHLRVTRTSDGVRIERPGSGRLSIEIFGFSKQSIQVDVPRDSHVEIADCAGADVFGINGGTSVHSNDGHVTLTDMQGSIDARSDDGYLSATNVHGDHLGMVSSDGHLALKNVIVGSLLAQTRDGRIEADALSVTADATLQTDDGSIALKLAPNADLTIDASTRDGHIVVDGNSLDRDDAAQRTIRLGAATGKMKVATDDGSIPILTNGDSLQ